MEGNLIYHLFGGLYYGLEMLDYEGFLHLISSTFSLCDLAQRESVELSIIFDGAEILVEISHLTACLKVTDERAINPRDGVSLFTLDGTTFGNYLTTKA